MNPHDLYWVIRREGVSKIVHTAANPLLTLGAKEDPYRAIRINIMGTANVLEAARRLDVRRVVFTSSNAIVHYSVKDRFGFLRPTSVYASTKLASEYLGFNYMDQYGLEFVVLRFSVVIGPWKYGGGGGPTQRFKDLLERVVRGEKAEFPRESRDYIYSKDAAGSCISALRKESSYLKTWVYPVSMGRKYSGQEIVEILRKYVPSAEVELTDEFSAGLRASSEGVPDLRPTEEELGFRPKYGMEEAMRDYLDHLRRLEDCPSGIKSTL